MIKEEIISCPYCSYEYFPAEIYYPNSFFGRPQDIERNELGVIVDYSGTSLDQYETYKCDKCNKKFKVKASIRFSTYKVDDEFENVYKVPLYPEKMELSEA